MPPASLTTTPDEFVQGALQQLTQWITAIQANQATCTLALSGGSTPGPVYSALGLQTLDWNAVTICLADERYVEPRHEQSNQKLIHDTLLVHAKLADDQRIFPNTQLPLEQCVTDYNQRIAKYPIDIAVLGMGSDGHIASLFPPVPAEACDASVHAVATVTDRCAVRDRISLSLPTLVRAKHHLFLLKGNEKKRIWEQMQHDTYNPHRWPAQAIWAEHRSIIAWGE